MMISRRRALGYVVATSLVPLRVHADAGLPRMEVRESLAKRFADDGTAGVFVAYDPSAETLVGSDARGAARAILPASTFKIANSIIALETGVVADPDRDVFKWDGVTRAFPDWNRDHTLRTAIAASAVPVYQEIARRVGTERMQALVDKLDYGNRDIGGAANRLLLAVGQLAHQPAPTDRVPRPPATRRSRGIEAWPGSHARYYSPHQGRRRDHSRQVRLDRR
jgi:beta-lactamase class D